MPAAWSTCWMGGLSVTSGKLARADPTARRTSGRAGRFPVVSVDPVKEPDAGELHPEADRRMQWMKYRNPLQRRSIGPAAVSMVEATALADVRRSTGQIQPDRQRVLELAADMNWQRSGSMAPSWRCRRLAGLRNSAGVRWRNWGPAIIDGRRWASPSNARLCTSPAKGQLPTAIDQANLTSHQPDERSACWNQPASETRD